MYSVSISPNKNLLTWTMACLLEVDLLTHIFNSRSKYITMSLTKPDWRDWGRETDEEKAHSEQTHDFRSVTNRILVSWLTSIPFNELSHHFVQSEVTISEYVASGTEFSEVFVIFTMNETKAVVPKSRGLQCAQNINSIATPSITIYNLTCSAWIRERCMETS